VRILADNLGFLLGGIAVTLELAFAGYIGGFILGTVLAVFRVSPVAPLRVVGATYVELFRNIPLLSLMVLFIFGLPDVGLTFSLFWSAAACLAFTSAAYVCEAVRGGINAVSVGQAEAARAIGLTFTQSLRHVVLPQAGRTMVQPLVNVFIAVLLGTALAAAVGVSELTNRAQQLNLQYAEAVLCFAFAGAVYLVLALASAGLGNWLERRLEIPR
jgi:glutamate transport system permease protein